MASLAQTNSTQTDEIENNQFLSGLAFQNGSNFDVWNSTSLTFDMNKNGNPPGENAGTWTDGLTKAINKAVKDIEAVSGVNFTETNGNADVEFWAYKNGGGEFGYSYGIGGPGVFIAMDETVSAPNKFKYGGYDYITVIHELLHNMGLAHPHDSYEEFPGVSSPFGDLGNSKLNQNIYTVMSYNDFGTANKGLETASGVETTGWSSNFDFGYSVMGAFDIAMLQTLYGANMSKATGNNVYVLPGKNQNGTYYKAIWDADGTDTIKYNGSKKATIDLNAATLDLADGEAAGGMLSTVNGVFGGFTIANGVVIENATGGSGRDQITGNSADNLLLGKKGKDLLKGKEGNDKIKGGAANDSIFGGSDNDILVGNKGDDKLDGGLGVDQFVFKKNDGNDVVKDFEDGTDQIVLKAFNFADVNAVLSKFTDLGADDVMFQKNGTKVVFENLRKSELDISDFMI